MPKVSSDLELPHLREFTVDEKCHSIYMDIIMFIQAILDASRMLRLVKVRKTTPFPNPTTRFNFPGTLRQLAIRFGSIWTTVDLPDLQLLPHLRELEINEEVGPFWPNENLGDDIRAKFDLSMPKVDKLVIHLRCCKELRRWTRPQWKRWPGIKTLSLHGTEPISGEHMAKIDGAFGALVNLELAIEWYKNPNESSNWLRSGLRYIFKQMRQLRCLKLHVSHMEYKEPCEWDLILLGIESPQMTSQLIEDPTLWDKFCQENDGLSSIRSLQQLECLELLGGHGSFCGAFFKKGFISELVFSLGFIRMPRLTQLTLEIQDAEMLTGVAKEWQEQLPGRTVKLGQDPNLKGIFQTKALSWSV